MKSVDPAIDPAPAAGGTVTRFAPSPSGLLHLGHAASAFFAFDLARSCGGRFLLRIEDIDEARCRPEYEQALIGDLHWLGLEWELPVWRQSERLEVYRDALERLQTAGVVYPCFCTRREIEQEIARMSRAPHGPEGPLYPGICRVLPVQEARRRAEGGEPHALRLNVAAAVEVLAGSAGEGRSSWLDWGRGWQTLDPGVLGDVVLARKDIGTSYHLAVVLDDAAQGVTLVTRGEDLLEATHVHRLLQALLKLPIPQWWHHGLVRDEQGKRLAKSRQSPPLRELREQGWTPGHVREAVEGVIHIARADDYRFQCSPD